MQQKFLTNLILLVLLNLVVKPVSMFAIDAGVQNKVGAAEYGLYYSLLSFSYLFNILLDLGINNFTTKNVAQHPNLMAKYIGKIAGLRLLLLVLYGTITFLIAYLIGYNASVYPMLFVLIFQQFFISMIAYFRSYLSGMLLFKLDALLSVLDRLILIFLCGYLLYFSTGVDFKIQHFVWIQFSCYVFSFLVGLILVLVNIGKIRVAINKSISFIIIRDSLPYAILIILMALFTRVDSVMLERMLDDGATQVGYYAQGFRLIDAFFVVAMLFSNLLLPIFSRMIKLKEDVVDLFKMASKLLVWGALGLAIFCFWNAKELLQLIYTNDIEHSAPPFQFLAFTFVSMCVVLIYGTYLTALGAMKQLNSIAAIGLVVNVLLNVILIPKMGVMGVATSTLVTQTCVAFSQMVVVNRILKIRFELKSSISFVVYVVVLVGGMYLLNEQPLKTVYDLILVALSVVLFKVIDLKSFVQILKTKE
ncbi:MAG TPA: polysaccharide biosynthesis C-terminal domain-containing protein [Taishania sp.]|nr:polysaccharide biosynthesis C-terminal domain-containing protein [Taishania sp.]